MSQIIGRGRYARETYPQRSVQDNSELDILVAILEHNVQLQGEPLQVNASTLVLDSPLYTLLPGVVLFPGSPTVKVTGSITLEGDTDDIISFTLVRDRGTPEEVVLTTQGSRLGTDEDDLALTATLVSLDVNLVEGSTHVWSIVATSLGAKDIAPTAFPALILVEQKPSGTSVSIPTPPTATVDLLTAGNFAAFGGSGITTTGGSTIDGNIGVSPAVTSTAITGFDLVLDGDGEFATSTQVTGQVFAFNYANLTPALVNQATLDMITAYNDAAGRPADVTAAGGDISGPLATDAVYRYTGASSVLAAPLVLDGGGPGGVIIIQVAGALNIQNDILLADGQLASNVFIVTAGQVTIAPGVTVNANILSQTGIAMQAGAVLNGRALAQTAVTLINNTINP